MSEPGTTITTNNRAKWLVLIVGILTAAVFIIWAFTFISLDDTPEAHQPPAPAPCTCVQPIEEVLELPKTGHDL